MNSLTAVSDVDQRGARILARSGRSDGKRAFRAAVRHSRHVRLLRIAVPLSVAVLLVGGVAFTALVKPLRFTESRYTASELERRVSRRCLSAAMHSVCDSKTRR